ncbi:MAG: hypothetical protein GEU96_17655 [Propionibacteriales bacterium]|nr:hypothetical protein [Propionibacteriales bacterium]
MRNSVRRTSVITAGVLGLAVTGVDFAAWTSTGSGTGSATAGHNQDLVVSAGDPAGLFPNGTVTVPVTVKNVNPYKVALDPLAFDTASTGVAGCDASVVAADDKSGLTDVLDADGGEATLDFVVSMTNDAADACQDATFTLTFTASGHSTS